MAKVAQAGTDLDNVLSEYNAILAKQKYLAADTISLADLFRLPNASAMKAFGYHLTFEKGPNVDEWLTGLENRETWIQATAEAFRETELRGVKSWNAVNAQPGISP